MELFSYLIKVTGCTAAFYLVYHIVFRKLTFFTLNRWYLLSALVLSLTIPLVHINVQTVLPATGVKQVIIDPALKTIKDVVDNTPLNIQQPQHQTDWLLIANLAYGVVAGILLFKLLMVIGRIVYKALKYGKRQNGYRLIDERSNSSFFNMIFLNSDDLDDNEQQQVITHELMHAKLMHSADNLFTEVLKTVLWFNPFVYLFAKALHQAHEFEVDRHLALQYNSKSYAGLLLKLSRPAQISVDNQFSAYGLKTRIQMLFGKRSATAKKLSYLLVLPMIAGLVYFLTVEHVYAFATSARIDKEYVLVLDAGHGGNTGGRANGVKEQDLTLAMVKQIKMIAEERGIKTILTRTGNTNVPLADRVKPQGDVFVSVHVNVDPDNARQHGSGMMVLTDRNVNKERSQELAAAMIGGMQKLNGIAVDSQVRSQGIYVLRNNKAPAVLLELGYLTNKEDLKYITDPKNQLAIAGRFVEVIIAYKNAAQAKAN